VANLTANVGGWAVALYKGAAFEQLGLANAIIVALGGQPVRFLQGRPVEHVLR